MKRFVILSILVWSLTGSLVEGASQSASSSRRVENIAATAITELQKQLDDLSGLFMNLKIYLDYIYPITEGDNSQTRNAKLRALQNYIAKLAQVQSYLSSNPPSEKTLKTVAQSVTEIFDEDKKRSLKIFGEDKKVGEIFEPAVNSIQKALAEIEQSKNPAAVVRTAGASYAAYHTEESELATEKIAAAAKKSLIEELETVVNTLYRTREGQKTGSIYLFLELGSSQMELRSLISALEKLRASAHTLERGKSRLLLISEIHKDFPINIFGKETTIATLLEPALNIINKALPAIRNVEYPQEIVGFSPESQIQADSRERIALNAEARLQEQLSGIIEAIQNNYFTSNTPIFKGIIHLEQPLARLNALRDLLQQQNINPLTKIADAATILTLIIQYYGDYKVDYFGERVSLEFLLEEAKKIVLIALVELSEYESSDEERSKSVSPPLSEEASQPSEIPGMPTTSSSEPYNVIELPKSPEREESQPESSMPDEQEPEVPQPIIIPQPEAIVPIPPAPAIIIPQAPQLDSTSTSAAPSSSVVRPTGFLAQIKGGTPLRKTTPQKRVAKREGLNAMFKNAADILSRVKPLAEESDEDDNAAEWASILNNSRDSDLSRDDDLLRPFMGGGTLAPQKNTELSPLAQQALAQALMNKRRAIEISSDDEEDWSEED